MIIYILNRLMVSVSAAVSASLCLSPPLSALLSTKKKTSSAPVSNSNVVPTCRIFV